MVEKDAHATVHDSTVRYLAQQPTGQSRLATTTLLQLVFTIPLQTTANCDVYS